MLRYSTQFWMLEYEIVWFLKKMAAKLQANQSKFKGSWGVLPIFMPYILNREPQKWSLQIADNRTTSSLPPIFSHCHVRSLATSSYFIAKVAWKHLLKRSLAMLMSTSLVLQIWYYLVLQQFASENGTFIVDLAIKRWWFSRTKIQRQIACDPRPEMTQSLELRRNRFRSLFFSMARFRGFPCMGGYPHSWMKWMVYFMENAEMPWKYVHDLGVPPFQETPHRTSNH